MKQGWEIKKLGNICETSSGGTPSKSHSEYYENGNIPWLRSGEISQGYIYETELYITEEGLKKSSAKIFPTDTVVIAMYGATVGQVGILKREMSTNQAVCGIFPTPMLYPLFLVYYLKAKKAYFLSLAAGGAQPNISQNIIKNTPIPVPPIDEQENIVAELDCLSGIIEKKKQQLKEYDALAQSIFYEMFGNPIDNEKGWEIKKLGEVATSQIGLTYKPENVTDSNDGTIVLRSSNIQNSTLAFEDIVRVDCEVKDNKFVRDGDILMCSRNGSAKLVGKVARIKNLQEPMSYGAFMTIIRSDYNNYLFEFFKLPAFRYQLTTSQTATINQITVKMLADINVPLPPLSLQQEFASKIEAIEKQKELIKQSIVETETLFNSRMDYYFN